MAGESGETRGGERKKKALVQRLGVQCRGNYSGEPRRVRVSHGGAEESESHAAHGREAAVTSEVICLAAKWIRKPR